MNLNLLGIDFEEWYHPQLVKPFVKNMEHEPKIIKGIEKIIELLQKNETTATFFMVGELLEHKPDILDDVRSIFDQEIIKRGWVLGSPSSKYLRFSTPKISELTYINKNSNGWRKRESFL